MGIDKVADNRAKMVRLSLWIEIQSKAPSSFAIQPELENRPFHPIPIHSISPDKVPRVRETFAKLSREIRWKEDICKGVSRICIV